MPTLLQLLGAFYFSLLFEGVYDKLRRKGENKADEIREGLNNYFTSCSLSTLTDNGFYRKEEIINIACNGVSDIFVRGLKFTRIFSTIGLLLCLVLLCACGYSKLFANCAIFEYISLFSPLSIIPGVIVFVYNVKLNKKADRNQIYVIGIVDYYIRDMILPCQKAYDEFIPLFPNISSDKVIKILQDNRNIAFREAFSSLYLATNPQAEDILKILQLADKDDIFKNILNNRRKCDTAVHDEMIDIASEVLLSLYKEKVDKFIVFFKNHTTGRK